MTATEYQVQWRPAGHWVEAHMFCAPLDDFDARTQAAHTTQLTGVPARAVKRTVTVTYGDWEDVE